MGAGQKRRRGGGELAQVAEMVMVLAAAGQARVGRDPTAAERALAAEARSKLAAVVEKVARPTELVPRGAVGALVRDLGLVRARDPAAMAHGRRRASIAERVLLTKSKMEGANESFMHSTANMPKTTSSSAITGSKQGASKSTRSPGNLSTPMTIPVISQQPLPNGTIAGASYVKPAIKVQKGVNGSQVTEPGGAATTDQAKKSYYVTATSLDQNSIRISSQAGKSLDKNEVAIHPGRGSVVMGHQTPSGELSVHKQSILSDHKEIAMKVERILYQPSNNPNWTVPSTEYMNTRLDCQICEVSTTDMESLLVCDACERSMHLRCLQCCGNQVMAKIEWYCPPCLAWSKGKLLPQNYGKVKRLPVEPKTSGAAQPSSQVTAASPTKKDCSKKAEANQSATNQNQNFDNVGDTLHKSSALALDTTSSKSLSISGAGHQKENAKRDEISFTEKERNRQPCGVIDTETANPCNDGHIIGASGNNSSNLSGGPHVHTESSSVNSVEDSPLPSTAHSAFKHSNHSSIVSSKENCEGEGTSYKKSSKNVRRSNSTTPTDEIYQADRVASNGVKMPHEQEILANGAISGQGNIRQVNFNGQICPDRFVGCSTSSILDWVGDALKVVNNKTYYNSCNIDGIIYNIHDHVLIATEGSKASPCKLQSMWQEHDSGSRLAMVNPYLFCSDIPEYISKPRTDEENEVYGSSDQRVVLLTAICGLCEVLHVDRVIEETKRRCQLDGSRSRLHPIFFYRSVSDPVIFSLALVSRKTYISLQT